MSDYTAVEHALVGGADPAMLCSTCPWDRFCVTPPSMTKAEVDAKMETAKMQDEASMAKAKAEGKEPSLPVGSLITALAIGGRHMSASICPVLAMRLRTSQGRKIVDSTKSLMQSWDDQA